jgi:hypothetical protein
VLNQHNFLECSRTLREREREQSWLYSDPATISTFAVLCCTAQKRKVLRCYPAERFVAVQAKIEFSGKYSLN